MCLLNACLQCDHATLVPPLFAVYGLGFVVEHPSIPWGFQQAVHSTRRDGSQTACPCSPCLRRSVAAGRGAGQTSTCWCHTDAGCARLPEMHRPWLCMRHCMLIDRQDAIRGHRSAQRNISAHCRSLICV